MKHEIYSYDEKGLGSAKHQNELTVKEKSFDIQLNEKEVYES